MTLLFEKLSLLFKRISDYTSHNRLNGSIEMTNHEISFTLFDVFTIILYKMEAKNKNNSDSLVFSCQRHNLPLLTLKYSSHRVVGGKPGYPQKSLHTV